MGQKFNQIYENSIKNPEDFWKNVSEDIFWFKKPTKILDKSNPPFYKWYKDGITNTCYNALDHHIEQGRGEKIALIYDSPITGNKAKFTFNQLKAKETNSSHKVIGIKEISEYLSKKSSLDQAKDLISIKTRQYAKRQVTWAHSKMQSWYKIDPKSINSFLKKI